MSLDLGPIAVIKSNRRSNIAHEFAKNDGPGIREDGRVGEEPGFDIATRDSVGRIVSAIIHELGGHLRAVKIVDEIHREFLMRRPARNASAID